MLLRHLRIESLETRKLLTDSWTNRDNNADVNADLRVSPLDAMIIVEALVNRNNGSDDNGGFPSHRDEHGPFVDVNADGLFSPLDVLIVVRQIIDRDAIVFAKLSNDTMAGGGKNSDRVTADPSVDIWIDNAKSVDRVLVGWDISSDSDLQDVTSLKVGNGLHLSSDQIRQLHGNPLANSSHVMSVRLRRGSFTVYRLDYQFTVDSNQI